MTEQNKKLEGGVGDPDGLLKGLKAQRMQEIAEQVARDKANPPPLEPIEKPEESLDEIIESLKEEKPKEEEQPEGKKTLKEELEETKKILFKNAWDYKGEPNSREEKIRRIKANKIKRL